MSAARLDITEKAFQRQIMDYAKLRGWKVLHVLRMRGSEAGWPDLSLVRPPRFLAVELKSEHGRPTPAQLEWLEALSGCGVETHLWKPSDWREIEEALR